MVGNCWDQVELERYWFETSDFINRGIHKYTTIKELLRHQYIRYVNFLKTFNISDKEVDKIILTTFSKPLANISAQDYLDFVIGFDLDKVFKNN